MAIPTGFDVPLTAMALPGTVDLKLADFPEASEASNVDAYAEAAKVIEALNKAIERTDFGTAAAGLFCKVGYWRDHLALSWNFRTVHTPTKIGKFLRECARTKDGFRLQKITLDTSSASRQPATTAIDGRGEVPGITAFLSIESKLGKGDGYLRLALEDGSWKIFTIYTCLRNLNRFPEDKGERRPRGVHVSQAVDGKNWLERRNAATNYTDSSEPQVLIIGSGQAGLTAAARLKMQNIDALIIDKNDRVGDNWRKRYHQLALHDPVWYDHMPYLNFPPQWPVFTPKDKLAQWFESYASIMELNVWMKTEIKTAKWDEVKEEWIVSVLRRRDDGAIESRVFRPRHIIQATGQSGEKKQPYIQGMENFRGRRICHSSEFPGATEGGHGKKAVIIGCCTSGHDIAHDFVNQGYDVTMVQRSSITVVSSQAVTDIALKGLYSEDGPPIEDADLIMHGMPNALLKALQVEVSKTLRDHDKDILDGLTRVGFKLDNGPQESGMIFKYFQRAGGYYIDSGTSKLIVEGKIKIKQSQQVTKILSHGLRFSDGSELEADEIIFATGYQSMKTQTRDIFGDEVADRLSDVWGFNDEGEWRALWQRTGHPGFWFHGGSMALCRYFSQLLALQIKGLEEKVYTYDDDRNTCK